MKPKEKENISILADKLERLVEEMEWEYDSLYQLLQFYEEYRVEHNYPKWEEADDQDIRHTRADLKRAIREMRVMTAADYDAYGRKKRKRHERRLHRR